MLFLLHAACWPAFALGVDSRPSAAVAVADGLEGVLEVLVSDDFQRGASETLYRLRTASGDIVPLEPDVPRPDLRTGDRVRMRRGALAWRVSELERSGESDGALESAWTTGAKKALVILLNFQDDTTQPYTVAQALSTMFGAAGSVAAFYNENSWGATTLSGDVAGWFTAPVPKPTTCDTETIQTQARSAASAAGYNRANYQFEIYVFPSVGACGWAGLAYVGWSGAWINHALSTYVTAHELGHNYGLLHAHSWNCGTSVLASSCSRGEYGDPFDDMGGSLRHFNAYSKQSLGWLTSGSYASLSGGSASVTLFGVESGSGVRGLRLSTDAGRTYWLEFRQPIGFDSSLSSNSNVMNGVLVRLAPSAVGGTDLLDMNPDGDFRNAALTVGNAYTDSGASLKFTPTSVGGGSITLDVQYGVTPPVAGFTFLPASPKAGQAVAFTNTSTGQPSSYAWDFDDGSVSTVKNPSHAFPTAGTYQVALIASNGAGASSAHTRPVVVSDPTALQYYSLTPCRLVDTRGASGPYGAPSLSSGVTRQFLLAGRCGIPSSAAVVALNVTATRASRDGLLTFSAGTSAVNFRAGQTRANTALAAFGGGGTVSVTPRLAAAGTVDLVLDAVGYFQ